MLFKFYKKPNGKIVISPRANQTASDAFIERFGGWNISVEESELFKAMDEIADWCYDDMRDYECLFGMD